MPKVNAKIFADSLNIATGDRLTTFLLPRFPRPLLAELNTHRMLTRNAASSRAIPIEKMIEKVSEDPYIPAWTINQRGMQGEFSDRMVAEEAELVSVRLLDTSINEVRRLIDLGIHKQNANRYLEPWMRVPVLVSGTEWENFFNLRCDEAAHPDFREVALDMLNAYRNSSPQEMKPGQWHTPYFAAGERNRDFRERLKIAVARAARISYATHDGMFDLEKDVALHDRLLESRHMSPFEHCAMAMSENEPFYKSYSRLPGTRADKSTRNYRGWYSYRAHLEDGVKVA